jgi:phospholipase/carboxylesterase
LPAAVHVDETGASPPSVPIFWGHGTGDPAIPFALAEKGRNRLRRAAAKLVARDYRIGHTIVPEEVDAAVAMVNGAD